MMCIYLQGNDIQCIIFLFLITVTYILMNLHEHPFAEHKAAQFRDTK